MPTLFKEIAGSPCEQYNSEGFQATRTFLVAWEDRDDFAAELLGTAAGGSGGPVQYPDKPTVHAIRLQLEPFDPDAPDVQPLGDLMVGLNRYSGSFAKAIVDYETTIA